MRSGVAILLVTVLAPSLPGSTLSAQSLREAVEEVRSGDVVFRFPIDEGVEVCENGIRVGRRWQLGRLRRGWQDRCTEGEAQLRMAVRQGEIRDLDVEPSDDSADAEADLGLRTADEAAAFLIELAKTSPRSRVAEDAIMPAMIARDVGVWPALAEMARDHRLDEDVREQAVFWLGQEVADAGSEEPDYESVEDDPEAEVREAAVFALSQRSDVESVPILIELARTSRHSKVRRSAVFWLSQTDDDRVVDFFEEILRGSEPVRGATRVGLSSKERRSPGEPGGPSLWWARHGR